MIAPEKDFSSGSANHHDRYSGLPQDGDSLCTQLLSPLRAWKVAHRCAGGSVASWAVFSHPVIKCFITEWQKLMHYLHPVNCFFFAMQPSY